MTIPYRRTRTCAALTLALFPLAALADEPVSSQLGRALVQAAAQPLITLLEALGVAAAGIVVAWLKQRQGSSKAAAFGLNLFNVAQDAVHYVDVTMKADILAAAQDGEITPDEARKLNAEAVATATKWLGEKFPAQAEALVGVAAPMVSQWLSGVVERAHATRQNTANASIPTIVVPPAVPAAVKAMLALIVLALGVLSTQAQAQALSYQVGPTIPFLSYEPGNPHPVSIAPGAGVQVSVTSEWFQRDIGGKRWDLLDLEGMAFGSVVSSDGGAQFGQLSVALGVCTMSSLFCVIGGKHVLSTGGAFASSGWFLGLSFGVNFALSPSPEQRAASLKAGPPQPERANTITL